MPESTKAELLSVKELSALLSVSVATIWRRVSADEISRPIKICGCTRWKRTEIEALIEAATLTRDAG